MFTGIIASTGQLVKREPNRLTLQVGHLARTLKSGSSIAVDGACLTVTSKTDKTITADVMPETFKKTTLSLRKVGDALNLELAMLKTSRFEGHIVTGHVEGVGKVVKIQKRSNSYLVTIQIPTTLKRYVIPKGSIALNGVSLTVIFVQKNRVTVGLIPHTWKHTNFHTLRAGDRVNVETDILAKYFKRRFT